MKKKHHISLGELHEPEQKSAENSATKTSFDIPSKEKLERLRKSQGGIVNEIYELDYSNAEPRTVMAFRIPKDSTYVLLSYLAQLEGKSLTEVGNAILTYYFSKHKTDVLKNYEKLLKDKINNL